MKLNNKGFSAVVLMAAIVVLSAIGGTGWYVWNANNSMTENPDPTVNQETDAQPKELLPLKDGYKQYDGKYLALQYPESWLEQNEVEYYEKFVTSDPNKKFEIDENNFPFQTHFTSPDYKPATELGPSVKAGYWLEVLVSEAEESESYENTLRAAKEAQEVHGGTYETIQIDGNNAVLANIQSHGTSWSANVYKDGKSYMFRFNSLDDKKPEIKEQFITILETVKLK